MELHGIDECLLDAIKNNHTNKQHHQHKNKGISQARPGRITRAQEAGAEGLYDRGDGVDRSHPTPFFRNGGNRVDYGRGIHPERHTEAHQVGQVTVLGGQGRDNDAKTQP